MDNPNKNNQPKQAAPDAQKVQAKTGSREERKVAYCKDHPCGNACKACGCGCGAALKKA